MSSKSDEKDVGLMERYESSVNEDEKKVGRRGIIIGNVVAAFLYFLCAFFSIGIIIAGGCQSTPAWMAMFVNFDIINSEALVISVLLGTAAWLITTITVLLKETRPLGIALLVLGAILTFIWFGSAVSAALCGI